MGPRVGEVAASFKSGYLHHVLSADLDLHDLEPRHVRNAWTLFVPPGLASPRVLLGFVEGTPPRWVKLVLAGRDARGAIDLADLAPPHLNARGLASLCHSLGADGAIVLEVGAIATIAKEIETHLSIDHDLPAQGLATLRAIKRHAGKGVWTHPPLLDIVPAPHAEPLQRTFDLLVPDDTALVGYVIADDRARVHTSGIAVKRGGDLVEVTTHAAIDDAIGERAFARDWPKQVKRVLAAVEDRVAKPSIGVFLEEATLHRILTGPGDQLARELNARRVIIDPAPAWLLGLLGGAAVAAMAGRAGRALASMLPQSARDRASALAHRAGAAMKESGAHPFALLGFDPIELWQRVKHHYKR
jgi:hypothetical protein